MSQKTTAQTSSGERCCWWDSLRAAVELSPESWALVCVSEDGEAEGISSVREEAMGAIGVLTGATLARLTLPD